MKLEELTSVILDNVVIYKQSDEDFKDLYKGYLSEASQALLDNEVRTIGAKRKGVVDIAIK